MKKLQLFCVVALLGLASCGPLSTLSSLGGGPQVNTNAQVGATNTQQLVASQSNRSVSAGRNSQVTVNETEQRVAADRIETVVVEAEIPRSWFLWSLLFGLIGWLLPSPGEMSRTVRGWFTRNG
jgi:hypothetical protein